VLQETWSKRVQTTHPFQVLDELGAIASEIISVLKSLDKKILDDILSQIFTQNSSDKAIVGKQKLLKYSVEVVAGLLLGSYVNSKMT
jgi:hypothetical protein